MKPTSAYKMSRGAKTALAVTWNRSNRGQFKRTIIEGELYGKQVIKGKRDRD
jgi:hypothetical protein